MDARWVATHVRPAAESVLPEYLRTVEAAAFLLAIGYQESRFAHRRQVGGPARGLWQFEFSGVKAVLGHPRCRPVVGEALVALGYPGLPMPPVLLHQAIEHHDALAWVVARALVWSLPDALPARHEVETGWSQYVAAWRPGRPRPESWAEAWSQAWDLVEA